MAQGGTGGTDSPNPGGAGGNAQGGGIYNQNKSLALTNCIVSGDAANGGPASGGGFGNPAGPAGVGSGPDLSGAFASQGHNLIGATAGSSGWVSSDLTGANPMLASLGNYGGPTETMALLPGSPAIDAGMSGTGIPLTDQRGMSRVGATDIGAFESQGFTLAPAAGSTPQTAIIGTAFANRLAVTVTANNPLEPVNGGLVSFSVPTFGPSAQLTSPVTIAGGIASVAATAYGTVGPYTMTATTAGSNTTSFSLQNDEAPSLVVNTTADETDPADGTTSLREAVAYAESLGGNQTLTFAPTVFNVPQTIILTDGPLDLSDPSGTITIKGPGANLLSISGNNASRVFVMSSGSANVQDVTITGGSSAADGGGLYITGGTLALTRCTVSGSSAADGGGLYIKGGTLALTSCTVSGNSATTSGGGLDNTNGTLSLTGCTVSGNSATTSGGGLVNAGSLTLIYSTVSGNSAANGAGLDNKGTLSLTNCGVNGNTATTCGGGLDNSGTATLTNCTLSGNTATTCGGGLDNSGTATLTNCTLSGNSAGSGGGLVNAAAATLTLGNTIVAGDTAGAAPDVSGTVASEGNNLIGKTDGSTGWIAPPASHADLTGTIASPLDPELLPLDSFGTMVPLAGSPVLNAGNPSLVPAGITTDQHGFPRIVNGMVDIGAVEGAITPSFVVNTTSDEFNLTDGLTSLRDAIYFANYMPYQTITFDPKVFASTQTITLTLGQLTLTNTKGPDAITGPAAGVTISGNNASRVFQVDAGVTAAFSGLTISGGSGSGGAGLLNSGMTSLTNCTVSSNSTSGNGGGLANNGGTLTLTNCTLSGNSATGNGGGLLNQATLTLTNCTLSGNTAHGNGGGLLNQATLTLTDCTLSGNSASGYGGGLYVSVSGTATLTNCTVAANQARGAAAASSTGARPR